LFVILNEVKDLGVDKSEILRLRLRMTTNGRNIMAKEKWSPCYCTIVLGILVVVFTWIGVTWAQVALTVVGGLTILKGIVGKCCCSKSEEGSSCCH